MNDNNLRHVAIIMDGNNRWAKREGKSGIAGHKAGVERIRDVLVACRERGIDVLTVFAFSSENWSRPPKEVEALMGLFHSYLKKEARKLAEENVALRVIGNRARFSKGLVKAIEQAEKIASTGDSTLVIAADYGGRWDMMQAAKAMAQQIQDDPRFLETFDGQNVDEQGFDEQSFERHLSTADLPPLDLLIRTGGELRISNFLLWQAAYAELYFTPLLWPEFNAAALNDAVDDFYTRQRRFGKTGDQIEQERPRA